MRKRLLFITYKRLGSVMEGGGQGALKNYNALCSLLGEQNVVPYYVHDDDKKRSLKSYIEGIMYMPFGYYFGLTPRRVRSIVEMAQDYDFVFIDRSLFGVIAKQLKANGYQGKIITYYHNVEAVYIDAKINKFIPFRRVLIRCADRNDRWGCVYSDKVIVLNERDNMELQKRYSREADILIPVTLKDQLSSPQDTQIMTSKKPKCLSIGAYFAPNNEGFLWFVKNVLPHVDVEYKIVGKGMNRLKQENPKLMRDIEIVSDAPSLTPFFNEADMMILPIFSGSGMKVKTCESLMYGKNILGTDEAFEGYKIVEGESGWRCNTVEEFIECINDFAQHPRLRFNQAARKNFLDNYSIESVEEKYKELLS